MLKKVVVFNTNRVKLKIMFKIKTKYYIYKIVWIYID